MLIHNIEETKRSEEGQTPVRATSGATNDRRFQYVRCLACLTPPHPLSSPFLFSFTAFLEANAREKVYLRRVGISRNHWICFSIIFYRKRNSKEMKCSHARYFLRSAVSNHVFTHQLSTFLIFFIILESGHDNLPRPELHFGAGCGDSQLWTGRSMIVII
jgi:hypothetical protein